MAQQTVRARALSSRMKKQNVNVENGNNNTRNNVVVAQRCMRGLMKNKTTWYLVWKCFFFLIRYM